jgi:hypothetical protein
MADGTGRSVYLIRQNIDHLYGAYLARAVIIAPGPGRAVKELLRHVRLHRPAAIARRSRLDVVRIGENAPAQLDSHGLNHPSGEATVVAVVFGEDDGQ